MAKLGESAFAGQSDILMPEVAMAGTFTHEDDLEVEHVGRNADFYLYISNEDAFEDGSCKHHAHLQQEADACCF